jgi:hypothetical protein
VDLTQYHLVLIENGMTDAQAAEACKLAHGATAPLTAVAHMIQYLDRGVKPAEVLISARKLWGGSAAVEQAKSKLRAAGMTAEQVEETARLAFVAATHTVRPNSEVMLEGLQLFWQWLDAGIPVETVLERAKRLCDGT